MILLIHLYYLVGVDITDEKNGQGHLQFSNVLRNFEK